MKLRNATIQLHLLVSFFFDHYQHKLAHDPLLDPIQTEEFWWRQFKEFVESRGKKAITDALRIDTGR